MSSRVSTSQVEVFLLVEQPRQRVSHWTRALAPLDEDRTPPPDSVDAFYELPTNLAIFRLRYDEAALGPERLSRILEVTVLAEVSVIHPADLSNADRRRLVTERLASCAVHVGDHHKVVSALVELVRRVRGHKPTTSPPATQARARAPGPPRAAASDPLLVGVRGTRTEPVAPAMRSSRELARGTVGQARVDVGEPTRETAVPQFVHEGATSDPVTTPSHHLAQRRDEPPRPSPNVVTRAGVHRANTVTMSTLETERMIAAAKPPLLGAAAEATPTIPELSPLDRARLHDEPVTIRRDRLPIGTELDRARAIEDATTVRRDRLVPATDADRARSADEPTTVRRDRLPTGAELPVSDAVRFSDGADPGMIYARYLRGGRWVPIRVGALSLRGATLMAGALPRSDDRVDVALTYVNHRAVVRGAVTRISTRQEAATSGAATFSVSFELEDEARRQLTALLTAARAANVTIKPPPPRSTRRYPVEWPICLGTARGAVRAEALDVSADGMFVKPLHPLSIEAILTLSAVLDDGLSPVSGRTRVVRQVSDTDAHAGGLTSGYGLSIIEMAEPDRARWGAFLARIEKRAARRVLIGASPMRLAELQGGLAAAGYAVTGGTDPGAIAQLASGEAHPVDAALVDAAWVADGPSPSWIESLFSARNVPCVTIHGDARRARVAIDRLLAVV
jgi:hypothetical protein